jgi:2-polyprenyl-3-methyl-5-hydroxy-6-metoxy-1,4-benzoquinol methylase
MHCRVCSTAGFLELVLDLGHQPWGNNFLTKEQLGHEAKYPLRLVWCSKCKTSQLDHTVSKEIMFSNHTYLSGTTQTLKNHFDVLSKRVKKEHFSQTDNPKILDIGSNDGTQLSYYKNLNFEVLGVESSNNLVQIALENGIKTTHNYFDLNFALSLDYKFDLINASGVFFHLEDLHSACEAIKILLDKNGIFLVQFIYMQEMQKNSSFDQIYHEHLLYYNLETINYLLNIYDLELFDAFLSPIHGGSVIGFVGHKNTKPISNNLKTMIKQEKDLKSNEISTYLQFAQSISGIKNKTTEWVSKLMNNEKKIMGLGAPVKGNTLLNYFGFDSKILSGLLERNTSRRGLYAPGSHIPIIIEDELDYFPDAYLVLAWNFKTEILERHKKEVQMGTDFFFPIDPK